MVRRDGDNETVQQKKNSVFMGQTDPFFFPVSINRPNSLGPKRPSFKQVLHLFLMDCSTVHSAPHLFVSVAVPLCLEDIMCTPGQPTVASQNAVAVVVPNNNFINSSTGMYSFLHKCFHGNHTTNFTMPKAKKKKKKRVEVSFSGEFDTIDRLTKKIIGFAFDLH